MYQAHARQLLNQKESETDSYMQYNERPIIDRVTRRLADALDRLERNLQHVTVQQDRSIQQEQQLMSYTRENDALRSECGKLRQHVAQLEEQYAELQKVAST